METILGVIIFTVLFSFYIQKRFFDFKENSSSLRKWKSPFAEDTRKPLTPLETDKVIRDQVMRKAFTKQLATEKKWDAIVIGSGLGGLSNAALLSKAGMKVLVLEKHYKCGGACHTFNENGYEFDVGVQYTGNLIRPNLVRTYLDQISDGQIQWNHFDGDFDQLVTDNMSPSRRKYSVATGPGVFKNQLMERFPDDVKSNRNLFLHGSKSAQPFKYSFFLSGQIASNVADSCAKPPGFMVPFQRLLCFGSPFCQGCRPGNLTDNNELQLLLSYSSSTFILSPSRINFSMNSTVLVHHLENGFCFPKGGGSEIPYRILPVIERSGGRVLTRAHVTQIQTDGGKVTGVRVARNKGNSADVDIRAPVVISDAGILNTLLDLVPEEVAKTSLAWPLIHSIKPSIGCLSVSVGFKGTQKELELPTQNIWMFNNGGNLEKVYSDIFNIKSVEELLSKPFPLCLVSSGSAKDSSWEQRYPRRSTLTVLIFVPYSLFSQWSEKTVKKRGEAYNSIKNELGKKTIQQFIQLYPELKNAVDHVSVGTPITMQYFLNAKEGAVFGMEHDVERFGPQQASLLRPESGIEGLFFSGQDIMSGGIYSTLISGFLCASAVLKKKFSLAHDLYVLHKQIHGKSQRFTDLHF